MFVGFLHLAWGLAECDKFYRGTNAAQSLAPHAGGSLTARCGNDASWSAVCPFLGEVPYTLRPPCPKGQG